MTPEEHLAERATAAAQAWSPGCLVHDPEPLPGGASSRTYVADIDGAAVDRLVLKVAPEGLEPVRNRDVLRQARVLRLLKDAPGVRVPEVLFEDHGAPVEIPPMFGMSYVEGDSIEPHLDPLESQPPPEIIAARALAAARMLASLHAAPVDAITEAPVPLTEEIDRWVRSNATVPDDLRVGADECAALLHKTMPAEIEPRLVHGDYRLGNMLSVGADVRAIVDWEIWSLGDPRVDLGWFLLAADFDRHPSVVHDAPGMPRPDALKAEYERAGGASTQDAGWFIAHALFKMAAVLALLVKRARRGGSETEFTQRAGANVPRMIERARDLLR